VANEKTFMARSHQKAALKLPRYVLCICVCLASHYASIAAEIQLGATKLSLPSPAGQCVLDASNPKDARLLSALERLTARNTNRVLATFADCNQLKSWRSGERSFEIYSQYQTLEKMVDKEYPPTSDILEKTCAYMSDQTAAFVKSLPKDINQRAKKLSEGLQLNQEASLGVVAQDKKACYASTLTKGKDRSGLEKTQISLMALSIIKGKIIYFYTFSPYNTSVDVKKLLLRHMKDTGARIDANRNAT
jgi:hypothetical protein